MGAGEADGVLGSSSVVENVEKRDANVLCEEVEGVERGKNVVGEVRGAVSRGRAEGWPATGETSRRGREAAEL